MGEQEFIRAEHINKTFSKQGKKIKAVDDVSLELYRGECFGLIGESGSGKNAVFSFSARFSGKHGRKFFLRPPIDAPTKISKKFTRRFLRSPAVF